MVDDAFITTAVKEELATDGRVSVLDINVSTRNGVVCLRGQVDTESQRAAATEVARGVLGVVGVHNELGVRKIAPGAGGDETAMVEGEGEVETWR